MSHYSAVEENYIKTIYHLQQQTSSASTKELAVALGTSAASITDMLKKLSKKKLVHYKAYYGCTLTTAGKVMALNIIRRHRLWEYFLSQKLGFTWEEIHEIAEELEHVSNEKLITRLDQFLGYPKTDPHGDPIPDSKGKLSHPQMTALSDMPENKTVVVSQIGNQSNQILTILKDKHISIGTRILITKKYPFDESMEIKTDNKHQSYLTKELSQNIYIKN